MNQTNLDEVFLTNHYFIVRYAKYSGIIFGKKTLPRQKTL